MQKAKAIYTQGNWGIEFDTGGNKTIEICFMKACRTHLKKRIFPTAQWCLDDSHKDNVLRVICFGPDARADTRDAAVILSAATHMDIQKGARHG